MDLKKLMSTTDSWGLLGLRLVTGSVFIAHGLPKFGFGGGGLAGTAEWLGSLGFPLPMVAAFLVASSEVIGGGLLIIGFMTRLAAATQVFAMLIAVFRSCAESDMKAVSPYEKYRRGTPSKPR